MNRLVPPLLCAALALSACTTANDQSGSETTASSTSSPATTGSLLAACADVADKAGVLLAAVGRLATGDATAGEVGTAAGALSAAFDDAMTAVGPDVRADLEDAGEALGRVENVLTTQPIDTAALRSATDELLTELGDAAGVCTPDSTTGSTTGSTTSTEEEPTSTTSSEPTVTTTS